MPGIRRIRAAPPVRWAPPLLADIPGLVDWLEMVAGLAVPTSVQVGVAPRAGEDWRVPAPDHEIVNVLPDLETVIELAGLPLTRELSGVPAPPL